MLRLLVNFAVKCTNMKKTKILLIVIGACLGFSSCGSENSFPRPWGYHRIEIPETVKHISFENKPCAFTFEYPDLGEISRNPEDSCWVDIYFKTYDCKWHISQKAYRTEQERNQQFEDFRKLVYKHAKKASNIPDIAFENENGKGVRFEVYGNVATPVEIFFHNDKHTLMATCYFNTAVKNDSLAPIIDFMKKEMTHTIGSIKFK